MIFVRDENGPRPSCMLVDLSIRPDPLVPTESYFKVVSDDTPVMHHFTEGHHEDVIRFLIDRNEPEMLKALLQDLI